MDLPILKCLINFILLLLHIIITDFLDFGIQGSDCLFQLIDGLLGFLRRLLHDIGCQRVNRLIEHIHYIT